jgi:hypothetical protein
VALFCWSIFHDEGAAPPSQTQLISSNGAPGAPPRPFGPPGFIVTMPCPEQFHWPWGRA